MMTKTYDNLADAWTEYNVEVNNAVVSTDCMHTPQMSIHTMVNIGTEDSLFDDIEAVVELSRHYNEDGELERTGTL